MEKKSDYIFDKEFTCDIVCHFDEEDGTYFWIKKF